MAHRKFDEKTQIDDSSREKQDDAIVSGTTLGDYTLLGVLGRGGMGVVYRARQVSANRIVALKVIRQSLLDFDSSHGLNMIVERFKTEARAAAQLEHDNAITVFDVGEVKGRHYYSMRLVEGETLKQIIHRGPLEDWLAARYLADAAAGVHHAHQQGILHRDIKPGNILIDGRNDRPLVSDFGLARFHMLDSTTTRTEDLIGSPSYMSPEQAMDPTDLTPAADIYSLGATLYHAITGRPPFQSSSTLKTLDQVRNYEPAAPRELNPAIDRDLETICLKCLAKEPGQRYKTAMELSEDLRRFVRHEPIVAKPPSPIQRFFRWYPRHASMILGAYYMVTPLTWVFFILGGLLQAPETDALRLASPIFMPWAVCWIAIGYLMLRFGFWFEMMNIPFIIAFGALPFFLHDDPQSITLIVLISAIGCLLQTGASIARLKAHQAPKAEDTRYQTTVHVSERTP